LKNFCKAAADASSYCRVQNLKIAAEKSLRSRSTNMSKLEEVEQQLYQKEKETEENLERRKSWRMFFRRPRSRTPTIWVPEHTGEKPDTFWSRHVWQYFFVVIILMVIALAGIFVYFYLRSQAQEASIEIQTKSTMISGEVVTIPLLYKNISHTVLREGQIALVLPPGSLVRAEGVEKNAPSRIVVPIDDLRPDEQGVMEITARLFGKEGEDKIIEAVYSYHPENFRAQFATRVKKAIRIAKVPLAISWEIPETLSRNQDVEMKVHYILDNSPAFTNVSFKMEYPAGFVFESADPAPNIGETLWNIGTIQSGQEGVIIIRGKVTGEEGEKKTFHATLGLFNEVTKEFSSWNESNKDVGIAVVPLSVQGFLGAAREGVIKPGDKIELTFKYRNNTSSTLKNITVRVTLEGSILDIASLDPDNDGVVDARTGDVIWGPGNTAALRELDPDEGGELKVVVIAKDPPPVKNISDKNLVVKVYSSINAASLPEELRGTDVSSTDMIQFKVASKVGFSGKALHGAGPIANTGPFPPRAGEKTTYTIVWEIKNFTNNLSNAKVTTTLPPNVAWESVTRTEGTTITYDRASSQVTWDIGSVPAGTGVLMPTLTGAFQVSAIPAEANRGGLMRLINVSVLKAIDAFTNAPVERSIDFMTTALPFDPTAQQNEGIVQ